MRINNVNQSISFGRFSAASDQSSLKYSQLDFSVQNNQKKEAESQVKATEDELKKSLDSVKLSDVYNIVGKNVRIAKPKDSPVSSLINTFEETVSSIQNIQAKLKEKKITKEEKEILEKELNTALDFFKKLQEKAKKVADKVLGKEGEVALDTSKYDPRVVKAANILRAISKLDATTTDKISESVNDGSTDTKTTSFVYKNIEFTYDTVADQKDGLVASFLGGKNGSVSIEKLSKILNETSNSLNEYVKENGDKVEAERYQIEVVQEKLEESKKLPKEQNLKKYYNGLDEDRVSLKLDLAV